MKRLMALDTNLSKTRLCCSIPAAGSYISSDRTNVFSILESRDFEPKNMLVLESDPGKRANAGFKKADVAFYSPNRIVINASLDSPGFLFLSEVWYPGWKAYDNGRETEIYRADYIFRAAHLEKGTHVVEFVFQPLSYTIGKSAGIRYEEHTSELQSHV